MNSGQVASRSREEIAEAIRTFTSADWVRLTRVAGYFAAGRPIEPEDLLQEAFERALDSRTCPVNVDVVKFLAEAIRSIAHGESEKVEHRLVSVAQTENEEAAILDYPDPNPSSETKMIIEESTETLRCSLLKLFDDDQHARDIVEGTMSDMTAEELRELTGLDKTAYDSKRRLIRRRIDKAFPDGWKS